MRTHKKEKRKHNEGKIGLDHILQKNMPWVSPVASAILEQKEALAEFIVEFLSLVSKQPITFQHLPNDGIKNICKLVERLFPDSKETLDEFQNNLTKMVRETERYVESTFHISNSGKRTVTVLLEGICLTLKRYPRIMNLLKYPQFIESIIPNPPEELKSSIKLIQFFYDKIIELLPKAHEFLFQALDNLEKEKKEQFYLLAEDILRIIHRFKIKPNLKKNLSQSPRGRLILGILLGAIESLPGETCVNIVFKMSSIPKHELTIGKLMATAIEQVGGLLIKITQVISELCPPHLARDLKRSQDEAGGLHPSLHRSWDYFNAVLNRPEMAAWRERLTIPGTPKPHFASASMGAIYEVFLNEHGRQILNKKSVLIKVQRPGLRETFLKQYRHILSLIESAHFKLVAEYKDQTEIVDELNAVASTIKRSLLNYYTQSQEELDFNLEAKNAARVQSELGDYQNVRVPRFYETWTDVAIMERIPGVKITKIVHTKYLERKRLADELAKAYLYLVFNKGVIWADPHPGNILYDSVHQQTAMIDLNPCFVWDQKTRHYFKHLLYGILFHDEVGIFNTLKELVEKPEALQREKVIADLKIFLDKSLDMISPSRFAGDFIKTLSTHNIELKIQVQAALRGLSQIALTVSSISVRNGFAFILRSYFSWKEIFSTIWQVGFFKVTRVFISRFFEVIKTRPIEETGPVLDERDVDYIEKKVRNLRKANVCSIQIRRINPDESKLLRLSQDGQTLLISSELKIRILEKKRPATVAYIVLLPNRDWLKERQEFIKLGNIAQNLCTVECLEQIRRTSLDTYWKTLEAMSKSPKDCTFLETKLIGDVKVAARKLYSLRFKQLWDGDLIGITRRLRFCWKLKLRIEIWKEESQQKFVISKTRKFGHLKITKLAVNFFYRIKFLAYYFSIALLKKYIKSQKFCMHLIPTSTKELGRLMLLGLARPQRQRLSKRH